MKKNFNYVKARKSISYRLEVYTIIKSQIEQEVYLSDIRSSINPLVRWLDKYINLGLPKEYIPIKSTRSLGEILNVSFSNCLFISQHIETYLPELHFKRTSKKKSDNHYTTDSELYFTILKILEENNQ